MAGLVFFVSEVGAEFGEHFPAVTGEVKGDGIIFSANGHEDRQIGERLVGDEVIDIAGGEADEAGDRFDEVRIVEGGGDGGGGTLAEAEEVKVVEVGIVEFGEGVDEVGEGGGGFIELVEGGKLAGGHMPGEAIL